MESKPGGNRPRSTNQSVFIAKILACLVTRRHPLEFAAPSPQSPHVWDRSVHGRQSTAPSSRGQRTGDETQPSWSPDGRKITFSTGELGRRESEIRILDLANHQSTLPGSDGKFVPRWSADGYFINAASIDGATIYIFNIKTQHWTAFPATGGETKLVVSLKNFSFTGTLGLWFGLDPTDAPLMLRDASTADVYVMTLEER